MVKIKNAALLTLLMLAFGSTADAQFQNPQAERPIINSFRQRATNNLLTDAAKNWSQNSKLSGKVFPKTAAKRNERFKEATEDRQTLRDAQKASLEKLQEEAKKAKFEAKALEEADYEKHKPWDVAAPENADAGSPLLAMAAESKQQQDLAPKKIRALEYLATLGCSSDPNVEKAILEGLKDHNPAVRWAAIQAVIASARGASSYGENPFGDQIVPAQPVNTMIDPLAFGLEEEGYPAKEPGKKKDDEDAEAPAPCEECENCKKKRKPCFQRLKGLCKRCKGHGCQNCNFGGHCPQPSEEACEVCPPMEEIPCEPCLACSVHDGCKSCCPSEAIMAQLKKIATEDDPDRPNCYFEPSIDVRNLALEALNVCPPLVKKIGPGGDSGDVIETDNQKKMKDVIEGGGDDTPSEDNGDETAFRSNNSRVNSFMSISHRRQTNQFSSEVEMADDQAQLLMNARIAKFYQNGFLIEFQDDYLIPVSKQLLVQLSDGRTHIVNVIKSETGFAQVVPLDGNLFNIPSTQLSVGVIQ